MSNFSTDQGNFVFKGGLQPPNQVKFNRREAAPTISFALVNMGLNCSANTHENVESNMAEVVSEFPKDGEKMVIAAPENQAKQYEYKIDNSNKAFSQMSFLLANLEQLQTHNIYYVAHHKVDNKFKASTVGAIKDAFKAAGKVIGQVQNGHIQSDQIASMITDMIGTLGDSKENDFHQSDRQVLFLIQNTTTSSAASIAGVKFSYDFQVKDVTNKKQDSHNSEYLVEQWNIVFTDPELFESTYERLQALTKDNKEL